MTNEEIYCECKNMQRYYNIPQSVYDEYRRDAEELYRPIMFVQRDDINVRPEIFDEFQEEAEELTMWLVEQAEIGKEIADGEEVTLEVTPDQWTLLLKAGMLFNRDARDRKFSAMQTDGFMYLLIPSGKVRIQVKPEYTDEPQK